MRAVVHTEIKRGIPAKGCVRAGLQRFVVLLRDEGEKIRENSKDEPKPHSALVTSPFKRIEESKYVFSRTSLRRKPLKLEDVNWTGVFKNLMCHHLTGWYKKCKKKRLGEKGELK